MSKLVALQFIILNFQAVIEISELQQLDRSNKKNDFVIEEFQ